MCVSTGDVYTKARRHLRPPRRPVGKRERLLFGLLVVVFATFQLYPRIEKIHTNHIRASQHATFEERFPVILCGRECPDDL